ncbi:MAG: drug/metabolite transporter (DMT)-like permease [Verrucomicrobiales bacterium]|jgi:drug/metabolite transporter (DMT)-like permease
MTAKIDAPLPATEPDESTVIMSTRVATLLVIATSLAMGSVPVFARELTDAGLSAVSVSFYRNLLGTVLLIGLLRFDAPRRKATFWALGTGVGMGLGWASYVRALEVVPVSTAGVIYMSYPLFAIGLAWLLFGQKPNRRGLFAGFTVLGASFVALGAEISGDNTDVLLVAFAAPVSFGFAVAVLTERLAVLRPIERVAPIAAGSTIGLFPIVVTQTMEESIPGDAATWLLVIGIGLFTAIGPQWVYSSAAPHVGAARAAVAGSVELPTMFIVGFAWFSEVLTFQQGVAGLMVLFAVLLVPSRQSPAITIVRRKRRLIPGRFYQSDDDVVPKRDRIVSGK